MITLDAYMLSDCKAQQHATAVSCSSCKTLPLPRDPNRDDNQYHNGGDPGHILMPLVFCRNCVLEAQRRWRRSAAVQMHQSTQITVRQSA